MSCRRWPACEEIETKGFAMRIAVLGTGMLGQAVAGKLAELGHEVVVGTRDPEATLARTEPDIYATASVRSDSLVSVNTRLFPDESGRILAGNVSGALALSLRPGPGSHPGWFRWGR